MIGFGADAAACDAGDLAAVQRQLDEIIPGYRAARRHRPRLACRRVLAGHLGDPPAGLVHAATTPRCAGREGRVLLAGSDLAAGWAGFIDGAIESGLRAGAWLRAQP